MGIPLEYQSIQYYQIPNDLWVFCGQDPLQRNIMIQKEFIGNDLQIRVKNI